MTAYVPHRVLILKPSSLGDIVHTLPSLAALHAKFPDAHFTWMVNPEWAPLLESNPHLDETLLFPRADFLDLTEAMWDQTLAVNLKAPFLCTQQAARRMIAQGRGGSIINITSGAAFRSSPRAAHYVSSKAGLVGLTRASAMALAPHQIRVNAVAPGITDTAQPREGMSEDEIHASAGQVPLGRIASASDIAPIVRFLASAGAAHVTGQTWHVNGGQYLA